MAKAQKQVLTLEEKLERALVLEDEQPYEIPSNWVWTKIGILSTLYRGVSYKKNEAHNQKDKNDCLILRGGNIKEGKVNLFAEDNVFVDKTIVSDLQFLKKDDIIIVSSTGSTKVIGRAGISDGDYLDVSFGAFLTLVRPIGLVCKKYVALFFQSDSYRNRIRELASGININNIRNEYITEINIPLPPLAEQQRIVDRIESLFEKLDKAKEFAQNALDTFETRKAAILHKAFTGELTAKWREENCVSMETWREFNLGNLVDTKYGYTESAHSNNIGPKFLRITDIQDNTVDWSTVPYCPISDDDYIKYKLNIGDIVVARTGATTGKSYLIQDNVEAVYASYLIRINIFNEDKLTEEYLYNFMQSTLYWSQITEFSQGIAQPGVNANKLKDLVIPVPSIQEQQEVIKFLNSLFDKEHKAKELCNIIDNIDLIKKSILARAFRGELGTNYPSEESATELLKKCL